MKKPSPQGRHSLAHEICHLGTGSMSVFEPSAFHGYTESMASYLGEIVDKGEEKVGEEIKETRDMQGQALQAFPHHRQGREVQWHIPEKQ